MKGYKSTLPEKEEEIRSIYIKREHIRPFFNLDWQRKQTEKKLQEAQWLETVVLEGVVQLSNGDYQAILVQNDTIYYLAKEDTLAPFSAQVKNITKNSITLLTAENTYTINNRDIQSVK
jgi:RNA-binding protein YlmH